MATWEDGPEYAPLERPDAFAEPASNGTVGLVAPPPPPSTPPAPIERPGFADPTRAVPPLAALVPQPPAGRDPEQPFDVASSVMTADSSAWASAHWAPPQLSSAPQAQPSAIPPAPITTTASGRPGEFGQFNPYAPTAPAYVPGQQLHGNGSGPTGAPSVPPPGWAPTYPAPYPSSNPAPYPSSNPAPYPSTDPAPYPSSNSASPAAGGPTNQPFPPPGYPPADGPFPSPGTPQWFAPGSYQPPPPPTVPNARTVIAAATPGVLITLVVGAFIWVLAPVTLVIAFLLTSRMTYGRRATRGAFAAVFALLGVVALFSVITADGLFSDWWDSVAGWACFGSWVVLVATSVSAYRAIKQGRPDPPPAPRVSLR